MAAVASQENSQLQVKSGVDLVTETDKKAEKVIIERLRASHPVGRGVLLLFLNVETIGHASTFSAKEVVPLPVFICGMKKK